MPVVTDAHRAWAVAVVTGQGLSPESSDSNDAEEAKAESETQLSAHFDSTDTKKQKHS